MVCAGDAIANYLAFVKPLGNEDTGWYVKVNSATQRALCRTKGEAYAPGDFSTVR
jgi:hypothetical protein